MNKTCQDCGGECCKHIKLSLVLLPDHDLDWLRARGVLSPEGVWRLESRCPHLVRGNRCDIYETRPVSCRQYPVNGRSCLEARSGA